MEKNDEIIFKSEIAQIFNCPITETAYMKYKNETIFNFINLFLIAGNILGLFSAIFTSTVRPFSEISKGMVEMVITNIIACAILVFLTLISYFYKKNIILQKITNYWNYLLACISLGTLASFVSKELKADPLIECIILIIEFLFKTLNCRLGLLGFIEVLIFSSLQVIYYWVMFPVTQNTDPGLYPKIAVYDLGIILTLVVAYLWPKQQRLTFYYNFKAMQQNKMYKNTIHNINSGFIHYKKNKIEYVNKAIINKILSSLEMQRILTVQGKALTNEQFENLLSETDSSVLTNTNKIRFFKENSDLIINFLLSGIINFKIYNNTDSIILNSYNKEIQTVPENISNLFFEDFKLKYIKDDSNDFIYVGNKSFTVNLIDEESQVSMEVFCRYYNNGIGDEYELLFNDISRTKMMEEKNAEFKYKTIFLSKIAHEFKNPLVCITELVDQMSDELKVSNDNDDTLNNSGFKRFLTTDKLINSNNCLPLIKSLSHYLLILIKDLDYFSESQITRNINIQLEETKIDELFSFCEQISFSLLKKVNKDKVIKFINKIDDGVPKIILTDEFKLKQILINLISNSIKFTNAGVITLQAEISDSGKIKFSVIDTGIGIIKEHQKNLFKPFVKGLESNNKIGAGLGLMIVKDLTQLLGSEIKYSSQDNKGTIFFFEMPETIVLHKSPINRSNKLPINITKIQSPYSMFLPTFKNSNHSLPITSNIIHVEENENNLSSETVKIEKLSIILPKKHTSINNDSNSSLLNCIYFNNTRSDTFLPIVNMKLPEIYDLDILNNSNLKKINIIVADDEALTRLSAIRMLKNSAKNKQINLNIIESNDGLETIYLLYQYLSKGEEISAILSDETMNYMNGSGSSIIINQTLKSKNFKKIPFFILTAYENSRYIKKLAELTVNGVFTKPLSRRTADGIINKAIGGIDDNNNIV